MRRLLTGVLVAVMLPVAVASAREQAGGYPNSIVVIGHSGATGYGSDVKHPLQDAFANSWATGTNPAVDSVYTRLVAANPAAKGHVANFAVDGAVVTDLARQIPKAAAAKPDLVIVQIGQNDIRCDGQDTSHYATFETDMTTELQKLTTALPQARVFVVGITGARAIPAYVKTMEGMSESARLMHAGKGVCSMFAPASAPSPGQVVPAHVAYVTQTFAGYEARLKAACAQFPQCTYDGGVAARLPLTPADVTARLDHLSIAGHAKLAAAEWAAMRSAHVIPG